MSVTTGVETIEHYYPFGYAPEQQPCVTDAIRSAAERRLQAGYALPDVIREETADGKPVDIIDIVPEGSNPAEALIFHPAMGCPLDSSMQYLVASVAAALPERRVIVAGNPSGIGYGAGRLGIRQAMRLAHGNWLPPVMPVLNYAKNNGVKRADHLGISLGADLALVAGTHSAEYGIECGDVVCFEPADVVARAAHNLAKAFGSTNKYLNYHVNESGEPAQIAARELSVSATNYIVGLARVTNLAFIRALCRGDFQQRAENFLDSTTGKLVVVYGTKSELVPYGPTTKMLDELRTMAPDRVRGMLLAGARHATMNNVHLLGAVARRSFATAA